MGPPGTDGPAAAEFDVRVICSATGHEHHFSLALAASVTPPTADLSRVPGSAAKGDAPPSLFDAQSPSSIANSNSAMGCWAAAAVRLLELRAIARMGVREESKSTL
jgi:hypothetical protein